jgi:hypothetical protein
MVTVYAVWPKRAEHRTLGRVLLLLMAALFVLLLMVSRFGVDTTGRYLLPLAMTFVILAAMLLEAVRRACPRLAPSVLVVVVLFNLLGTGIAAVSPDKITTQFGPATRFDNRDDQALIDFLLMHGGQRGFANYWVSFRIAFESGETILLAPLLPYRENLSLSPNDNRYPPYAQAAMQSEQVVYVTANQPQLDAALRDGLARQGVSFQEEQIGLYRVFYALSRRVVPSELSWSGS